MGREADSLKKRTVAGKRHCAKMGLHQLQNKPTEIYPFPRKPERLHKTQKEIKYFKANQARM